MCTNGKRSREVELERRLTRRELRQNVAAYFALEMAVAWTAAQYADPKDPFGTPVYLAFVAMSAHLAFKTAQDVRSLRRRKA